MAHQNVTVILSNSAGMLDSVSFRVEGDEDFSLQDVADAVERNGCWILADGDTIKISVDNH